MEYILDSLAQDRAYWQILLHTVVELGYVVKHRERREPVRLRMSQEILCSLPSVQRRSVYPVRHCLPQAYLQTTDTLL